jgi:hypothetical protein
VVNVLLRRRGQPDEKRVKILEDGAEALIDRTVRFSDSYAEFLRGFYRPLTFWQRYYRPINVPPPEEGNVKTINDTIDVSVFDRWRANSAYRARSLGGWDTIKEAERYTRAADQKRLAESAMHMIEIAKDGSSSA